MYPAEIINLIGLIIHLLSTFADIIWLRAWFENTKNICFSFLLLKILKILKEERWKVTNKKGSLNLKFYWLTEERFRTKWSLLLSMITMFEDPQLSHRLMLMISRSMESLLMIILVICFYPLFIWHVAQVFLQCL